MHPLRALTATAVSVSIEAARTYINQLDFTYLVDAMCAPPYPLPKWTREDALHCCQLYKNFLLLQKIHEQTPLVPTKEIDEFWHNHILYTKNYHTDCQRIFGYYLHHEPASPTEDPKNLIDAFLTTKQLYLQEFNQPLVAWTRSSRPGPIASTIPEAKSASGQHNK